MADDGRRRLSAPACRVAFVVWLVEPLTASENSGRPIARQAPSRQANDVDWMAGTTGPPTAPTIQPDPTAQTLARALMPSLAPIGRPGRPPHQLALGNSH